MYVEIGILATVYFPKLGKGASLNDCTYADRCHHSSGTGTSLALHCLYITDSKNWPFCFFVKSLLWMLGL